LVLSGSHRADDLLAAAPGQRPTFVGEDLRALLRPGLAITSHAGEFRCGQAAASAMDGRLMVHINGSSSIEAIWAAAHATWWAIDHGLAPDWRDALERLR
jgi:glycerol-1-phosphatase